MSNRYVLILKGSPREKGNSSILADQVADGASEAQSKGGGKGMQVLSTDRFQIF